jgi:hypothetical protein
MRRAKVCWPGNNQTFILGVTTMAWTNKLSDLEPTAQESVKPTIEDFAELDLMNQQQTAAFLKMATNTFKAAVAAGHLPDGIDYGKGKRWSKAALFNFIYFKAHQQNEAALAKQKNAASL